mmetsp:Transcript_18407/g.31917  ORF Transcript_18407/g.31917 Transcript_18407/m.31917 type:complete len:271 (+) Transcript_18407:82-894(+)
MDDSDISDRELQLIESHIEARLLRTGNERVDTDQAGPHDEKQINGKIKKEKKKSKRAGEQGHDAEKSKQNKRRLDRKVSSKVDIPEQKERRHSPSLAILEKGIDKKNVKSYSKPNIKPESALPKVIKVGQDPYIPAHFIQSHTDKATKNILLASSIQRPKPSPKPAVFPRELSENPAANSKTIAPTEADDPFTMGSHQFVKTHQREVYQFGIQGLSSKTRKAMEVERLRQLGCKKPKSIYTPRHIFEGMKKKQKVREQRDREERKAQGRL